MGKKIFLGVLILICVAGLGAVVWFGIQPKPIGKIKLSRFESPQVAAHAIEARLWEELRQQSQWWWGVDLNDGFQTGLLEEFVKNLPPESRFTSVWLDSNHLPPQLNLQIPVQKLAFRENGQKLLDELGSGRRVLFVSHPMESTPLQKEGMVFFVRQRMPFSTLVMARFPRVRTEENLATFPCNTALGEASASTLGCLVMQRARGFYRKKLSGATKGDHIGFLDQVGEKDYVLGLALEL